MKFPLLILTLIFLSTIESYSSERARQVGLLAGFGFPRFATIKAQYNYSEKWSFDLQATMGAYWSTQQMDGVYYFNRDEWSLFLGLGFQYWNFASVSLSSVNAFFSGASGNQAIAVTMPLGLQFVDDSSGFTLEVAAGADFFVSGLSGLSNRVIPEGHILIGKFF